jgi:hypothetical protein
MTEIRTIDDLIELLQNLQKREKQRLERDSINLILSSNAEMDIYCAKSAAMCAAFATAERFAQELKVSMENVPSKDRELLVELSKPNISFDDLCNESYVSNTVTDGKTTLLLGNSIEFTERDTKEGAEARIALRIRKHLEENPC